MVAIAVAATSECFLPSSINGETIIPFRAETASPFNSQPELLEVLFF
jgi:hypothetical protein